MTTTSKVSLKNVLGQTELVDPSGLSPFVALHLGEADRVHVRRTGAIGYVMTEEAPDLADPGWVYVAYGHLQDCLRYIESDEVELSVLGHGGLALHTVNSPFDTELRVHTVPRVRSGFKQHAAGPTYVPLDPSWLAGLNAKPFTLSAPPILEDDKVLLMTSSGMVVWTAAFHAEVPSFPRESFLKAVSGLTEGTLELTENGFYHAKVGAIHVFTAGHQITSLVVGALRDAAGEVMAELPAGRFIQALKAATSLAAQGASIQINPKTGILTKDQYANPARFSLGDVQPFPAFAVTGKTAKLLADALEQTPDEHIQVAQVLGHPDIFRLTRGICEVSFRTIPAY